MHPGWPLYLRVFLACHITFGSTAFVCAPVALAVAKGGKSHRRWGQVYFWAMAGVAVTALVLSLVLPILFLALVAVFSFYAAYAGYRVLYLKDLTRGGKALVADWAAALITFAASAALALIGAFWPRLVPGMGVVSIVFGLIGMQAAARSIRTFLRPPAEKQFWWYAHMDGMIGSYIAACTAFSAVNLSHWFGDAWWVWLWPTLLGVPATMLWKRYYQRKFTAKPRATAVQVKQPMVS